MKSGAHNSSARNTARSSSSTMTFGTSPAPRFPPAILQRACGACWPCMNSCLRSKVLRCRPLLGTFVELKASGLNDNALTRAVEKAFAHIERIQSLMSVHDDATELSLVNTEA